MVQSQISVLKGQIAEVQNSIGLKEQEIAAKEQQITEKKRRSPTSGGISSSTWLPCRSCGTVAALPCCLR